jgi:hypothetical protein
MQAATNALHSLLHGGAPPCDWETVASAQTSNELVAGPAAHHNPQD